VILLVSFVDTFDATQLLVVTTVGTMVAAVFLCFVTRRHAELHRSADQLQQSLGHGLNTQSAWHRALTLLPEPERDEAQVKVLRELSTRLAAREAQLNGLVTHITTVLTEIVHHRKAPSLEGLDLPTSVDRLVVFGAYRAFLRALLRLRKRAGAIANVLRRLPVAVVVATHESYIQSLNAAGERLFGKSSDKLAGHPLISLFANAPFGTSNPAQLLLVQNGLEAIERLRQGEQREVFTTIRGAYGQIVLVGIRADFGKKQVFLFRERNPKPALALEATQEPETLPALASYLLHEQPPSLN